MEIDVVKSKLKTKALFAMCRKGILLPETPYDIRHVRKVQCTKNQCKLLSDTSNNIIQIEFDGKLFFFRKCRIHSSKSQYVQELIEEFFSNGGNPCAKELIEWSLKSRKNLRRFFNMGVTNDRYSNVSVYYRTGNSLLLGIDISQDKTVKESVSDFIQYAWGEIYSYNLNRGTHKNEPQLFNANRALATYAVSKVIGLDRLIPETELISLEMDGNRFIGTLMANAPGKLLKWETPEKRKTMVSGALQRALNDLNLLDVLCYERDHKPSNYHVTIDENGKGNAVCAFDNDAPMTFYMHNSSSFLTFMRCSPYVKDHRINRPFLSSELFYTLQNLKDEELIKAVEFYLSKRQIKALLKRKRELTDAIQQTNGNGLKLLTENEWNDETVMKETCGEYGMTYLNLFYGDLHLPKQDWIKHCEENNA